MRHIKLYEEFIHDEIHDVMMSICDTVPFRASEEYPSTDRVRVYHVDTTVKIDKKRYEEYLGDWKIQKTPRTIVFVKGDPKEAALAWLKECYGELEPKRLKEKIYYVDEAGKPIFKYSENDEAKGDGHYLIRYSIWEFFEVYFDIPAKETQTVINTWLKDIYKLDKLTSWLSYTTFPARV